MQKNTSKLKLNYDLEHHGFPPFHKQLSVKIHETTLLLKIFNISENWWKYLMGFTFQGSIESQG